MQVFIRLFTLVFFLIPIFINAQTYYFDNYSVKQGLSQSTVRITFQDSEGYVWLGTQSGVSRFDGVNFINYNVNDGLAGNSVKSIVEDSTGALWLGHSGGGISRYADDTFQVIQPDTFKITSDVTSIVRDDNGNIWFATEKNGAFRMTNAEDATKTNNFYSYHGEEGLSDRVFQIHQGNNNELYFITDAGIKMYENEVDSFRPLGLENQPTYFQNTAIYQDSKGNIWIGTYNGGLYKYITKEKKFKVFDVRDGLANNFISCITENREGDIWVGTWGGGISRFKGNTIKNFNTENGLHDLKIFSITEDREGNMLIGTSENGLDIFKGEEFVSYSVENGLPSELVWAITQDNFGDIWIGTNLGIAILSPGKAKDEQFRIMNLEKDLISHNDIRHLENDRYGNIWVGTWGGGAMRFNNMVSNRREFVAAISGSVQRGIVTAMEIDRYGNVWVGSLDGLFKYNPKLRQIKRYSQVDGLSGFDISCIYADDDGVIWVGSRGKGLNKIVGKDITQVNVGGDITINALIKDEVGQLWIGTDGQGLLVCDPNGNKVAEFTTKDGLLGDLITLLEMDKDGNIWMGTNNGVNKFNVEEEKIYSYTEKNGFIGIESKNNASFRDRDGNLWFGTVNGVMKYSPDKARNNNMESLTHITNLKVNLNDVKMVDGMDFDYEQNSIYFNFNSIYLTNSSSIRYLYKLDGLDEKWSLPTKVNFANYPALPPGDYTFKVKAVNSSGIWNEEPASFSFTIRPPFWQTWWFYLICLAVLSGGIFYYIQWREQNLRREKKILEDKVEERTAEVVAINSELASKNKDITDSIKYAKRIQNAVLPPTEMVSKTLKNAFILFKPKDIVSGDFYWVALKGDKSFFAAVDCTGHGVPGAFMSIIGHNSLDKIISETDIEQPSIILDELNKSVSHTLRQKDEESAVRDGMDISLVSLDRKNMTLEFAAAHNSLYIIRNKELIEYKADKFAIGSFVRRGKNNFTNHKIKVETGDVIYVFSDGYADQFGGELGKKFKYRPFKEMLVDVSKKSMNKQQEHIEKVLEDWMGGVHEQIDDVLIIGVKV